MARNKKKVFIAMGLFLAHLPSLCTAFAMPQTKTTPFLWGVANASFQVEGSPADSDWYQFTHQRGNIKDGTNADVATDFWNRYAEDFQLAKNLGVSAFRISIAWERIQPSKDRWDEEALSKYEMMVMKLRELGIEPIVTLHHFVLPRWLANEGGLLAEQFPAYFQAYSKKVLTRLSANPARVQYWMTFNEPEILVFCDYFWGCWPPKHYLSSDKAAHAFAAIARAHIGVVQWLRSPGTPPALSQVRISIAKHWAVVQPKTTSNGDRAAAQLYDDMINRQIMNSLMTGHIYFHFPNGPTIDEQIPLIGNRPTLDYLGINYYQRSLVSNLWIFPYYTSQTGPGPKNDLGWEIYPQGLLDTLRDVKRYQLPILISENGVADKDDTRRSQFLIDHLHAVAQARNEGIPVFGYLHWSLTDNFEWADGLAPRFGLVEIDYTTLQRKPRRSYETYRQLISGGIDRLL